MLVIIKRTAVSIGMLFGIAYGVVEGIWMLAVFFAIFGVYLETVAMHDMLEERKFNFESQFGRFTGLFKNDKTS